ncbi:hypothetical protein SESBI_30008 [Sesbania bispinosa]|nr:hypothetical protein SESBI_30008 [Sesbania bispinosa]
MASSESTPIDLKPPDDGAHAEERISFRDKLLRKDASVTPKEKVDLISHNLFQIELEEGNPLKPKCFIADSVLYSLRHSWRGALILKLLGKGVGFLTMNDRLKKV